MMLKKIERFLPFVVVIWFGLFSLVILVHLWLYSTVMLYETNMVILGIETFIALLIIFLGFRGLMRTVLSTRR